MAELGKKDLGVEKDILNIASEEATLGKLNALIEKFPAELDDPEKQIVLCIIMTKKMHEGHKIRSDMISMIKPVTIDQWIKNYRQARAKARQVLNDSKRYQSLTHESYKTKHQRFKHNIYEDATNTNRANLKKQKRQDKDFDHQKVRQEIDWTIDRCRGCGKIGHDLTKCWVSTSNDPHRDRSQEPVVFHQSTKGKLWIADTAKRPLCHPDWHLRQSLWLIKVSLKLCYVQSLIELT
jgi:hypothetical protein